MRSLAEPARKPQRKPLSTTVTDDIDAQVRAEAKLHGITVSEMIARSLTERYAANVPVYNTTRGEDGTMTLSAEPAEYMPLPDHLSNV